MSGYVQNSHCIYIPFGNVFRHSKLDKWLTSVRTCQTINGLALVFNVGSSSSQKVPLHTSLGLTSEAQTGGEAVALGTGGTAQLPWVLGDCACWPGCWDDSTAPTKALRRSSSIAAKADVHALFKAEHLVFPGNSFTSFLDSKISSNLGRIGINLGSSDIGAIKNLEVDRLILCANLKKSANKSKCSESDDERDNQLETILNHACGDLNENLLDAENDQIIDLSPQRRRKKYNNAKNTNNGKLPKKPKTRSKISIKWKGFSGIAEV